MEITVPPRSRISAELSVAAIPATGQHKVNSMESRTGGAISFTIPMDRRLSKLGCSHEMLERQFLGTADPSPGFLRLRCPCGRFMLKA